MLEKLLKFKRLREDLALVDKYIDEFLQTDADTGLIADVFGAVRGTRGKMIRPILLLLSARFGPNHNEVRQRLCVLGALVEMVHMASLVHDDIIDDSPLRRGRKTVQARFGKDIAVYAGDFIISRVIYHAAMEASKESIVKEEMLKASVVLGNAAEEMCRGELGQKLYRWDTEMTIETYLRNIHGKTVALFEATAKLGALASGCAQHDIDTLGGIGENIGYLFQMRDDLLDFVSCQQQEAKPVRRDFSDGIYTMPVLYALGKEEYGGRLREIARLDAGTGDYDRYLSEVCDIVHASGGVRFAKTKIEMHAGQAREHLAALPQEQAKDAIDELIDFLSPSAAYTK